MTKAAIDTIRIINNNGQGSCIFREIIKNKKIVYEHISGPKFLATVTFSAEGNKTTLNWHMLFETAEQFEQVVKVFKADEGLKQNGDRLDSYLANMNIKA